MVLGKPLRPRHKHRCSHRFKILFAHCPPPRAAALTAGSADRPSTASRSSASTTAMPQQRIRWPPCASGPHSALPVSAAASFRHLTLLSVVISEDSRMFASCPALNSLMLEFCYGFRRLRISSQSLNSFGLLFYERSATEVLLQEVIVENHYGPLGDHDMRISVFSTPKLRMIGRFTNRLGRF